MRCAYPRKLSRLPRTTSLQIDKMLRCAILQQTSELVKTLLMDPWAKRIQSRDMVGVASTRSDVGLHQGGDVGGRVTWSSAQRSPRRL